jgi:hypothetical protein
MSKPPLLRDRSPQAQILLAVIVPFAFGSGVGIVLHHSSAAYWALLALAGLGGFLAGLDHDEREEAAVRGAISGASFSLGILFTHGLADTHAKVSLGSFPPALILINGIVGALLAGLGCWLLRRGRGGEADAPARPARSA